MCHPCVSDFEMWFDEVLVFHCEFEQVDVAVAVDWLCTIKPLSNFLCSLVQCSCTVESHCRQIVFKLKDSDQPV